MERRPPSARGQDRASHNSAKMKDVKEANAKNGPVQGQGSHPDSHEAQTNEAFLERMNAKLKQSAHKNAAKK